MLSTAGKLVVFLTYLENIFLILNFWIVPFKVVQYEEEVFLAVILRSAPLRTLFLRTFA